MKRALERIEIPGESQARERAWRVARAAHAERQPAPRRSRRTLAVAGALVVAGSVAVAAFSSPGHALLRSIRETVGVRASQPALFSLPAEGQLLVHSDDGVWVVQADGSKRRLGAYTSASWSPHGLYVAATRRNALLALTTTGEERWSLARSRVRSPRWTGTKSDTRIAYTSGDELRVVGGDGRGDAKLLIATDKRLSPLAWRPGLRRVLAYAIVDDGTVRVVDTDPKGDEIWSVGVTGRITHLEWSSDGRLLMVVTKGAKSDSIAVFSLRSRRPVALLREPPGIVAAAFRPGTHAVAFVSRPGEVARVVVAGKVVFSTAGALGQLAWSPDGRWLLVAWPDADQWVFVPVKGGRVRAIANVSAQFRSQSFPRIEGWCCAR